MNIEALQYCVDVAHLRSFTKAAKVNYVTQQALSQQIKSIEEQLGVKLFIRTSKTVIVTPEGEVFIKEVQEALQIIKNAITSIQSSSHLLTGQINIGYNGPSSRENLVSVIENLLISYPGIKCVMQNGSHKNMVEGMKNGSLDIVSITYYELFNSAVFGKYKCKGGLISAVVGKNHPLAVKDSVSPDELSKIQLICVDDNQDLAFHKIKLDRFRRACCGKLPSRIKYVEDSDTVDVLVASGQGFTLLSNSYKNDFLNDKVKYLSIDGCTETFEPWIIWKKDSSNPLIQIFLDEIKQQY